MSYASSELGEVALDAVADGLTEAWRPVELATVNEAVGGAFTTIVRVAIAVPPPVSVTLTATFLAPGEVNLIVALGPLASTLKSEPGAWSKSHWVLSILGAPGELEGVEAGKSPGELVFGQAFDDEPLG